jgi:hypothetical protein
MNHQTKMAQISSAIDHGLKLLMRMERLPLSRLFPQHNDLFGENIPYVVVRVLPNAYRYFWSTVLRLG